MNRRQKIIVSVVGIFIVLLALVGLTYAYFLTRVIGNGENKSISVTTASLQLVYANGSSSLIQEGTLITPSNETPVGTKTFTVTNNGNGRVDNYGVFLEEFAVKYANDTVLDGVSIPAGTPTSLASPSDMKLDIVCKAYRTSEYNANKATAESTDCTDMDVLYTTLPTSNDMLLSNGIDVGVTHEYTVTLTYLETGLDQSDDMNKTIEGLIQIYGLNDVVDIEGEITGANTGDYAQLNSEPKKSQIIDGKYKFAGVTPGNHTFSIFTKDGVLRGSKPITIKMGKVANTDNGIITINEESKSVSINIPSISTTLGMNIEGIMQSEPKPSAPETPYESGTLAEAIYVNATGVSDEEMATGIAKLSEPLSIPGRAASAETEATLSWTDDDYTETTGMPSYYFRGNVKNNFVTFSNMCWRIVRIDGNSNIKLALADEDNPCSANIENGYSTENEDSAILGKLFFIEYYNSTGTPGVDFESSLIPNLMAKWMNGGTMTIFSELSWNNETIEFDAHISPENQEKMATIDWCNDYTVEASEGPFKSTARLTDVNTASPTLKCNMTSYDGTSAVKYPGTIAMITADEAAFAGASYSWQATHTHYLITNAKPINEYSGFYWTMTSSDEGGAFPYGVSYINNEGNISGSVGGDASANFPGSVRPLIALKNTGDFINNGTGEPGTQTNPYVIK